MKYLLDTNTCARYLNGYAPQVVARIGREPIARIAVCSVVRAELRYGARNSQNPARNLAEQDQFLNRFVSLPFDDAAAEEYGHLRAHLRRLGTPIGANDMLIASIALANDLTLVTHNTREFSRVPNLRLEDWE